MGRENKTPKHEPGPKPPSCQNYDEARYLAQYDHFYYFGVRDPVPGYGVQAKHVFGAFTLLGLVSYWAVKKGLVVDLFPAFFAQPNLSVRVCLAVNAAAFIFMDLTSGIAHLCLDYMPGWTPIIGVVAKGFQE